jgi:hypothetical protein
MREPSNGVSLISGVTWNHTVMSYALPFTFTCMFAFTPNFIHDHASRLRFSLNNTVNFAG